LIARQLAEGSVDYDHTEVDADVNEVDEATQTGLEVDVANIAAKTSW